MASTPSSEERELSLIEKLEFRIIFHSNNESKLQETLDRYLRALLLKAESPHESVRKKTMEVAERIRGYISPPTIILPVRGLLEQFITTESTLLKTLDMRFLQHSVPRLDPDDRRDLAPLLIQGISKERFHLHAAGRFNLLMKILPDINSNLPYRGALEEDAFRKTIGLQDPSDAQFLAHWLGKIMVLKPAGATPADGVTSDDYTFLTRGIGGDVWDPSKPAGLSLPITRVMAVRLLATRAFTDEEKFIPAIWAAGCQDLRVSSLAEDVIKRLNLSMEEESLISKLFQIHSHANRIVRTRVLDALAKSAMAASAGFANETRKVVSRNIQALVAFYVDTGDAERETPKSMATREHNKLASATLSYVSWVSRIGAIDGKYILGADLLALVRDLLMALGWPVPQASTRDIETLRGQVYEAIGSLARTAQLTSNQKVEWTHILFQSLTQDPTPEVVVSIEGAISSMTPQFAPGWANGETGEADLDSLRKNLRYLMELNESRNNDIIRSPRYGVTKFANDCLPPDDVEARIINFMAVAGQADERVDVLEEGKRGLDLWNYHQKTGGNAPLPPWDKLATAVLVPTEPTIDSDFQVSYIDHSILDSMAHTNGRAIVSVTLQYCKNLLFVNALPDFLIDRHWEAQLETRLRNNLKDRQAVRNFITNLHKVDQNATNSLRIMLMAGIEGMVRLQGRAQNDCAVAFIELASFSSILPGFTSALQLISPIKSNSNLIRTTSARGLGILATQSIVSDDDLTEKIIKPLLELALVKKAVGTEQNAAEGALRALGQVLAYRRYRLPEAPIRPDIFMALNKIVLQSDIRSLQPSTKAIILDMLTDLWTAFIPVGITANDGGPGEAENMIDKLVPEIKNKNERAIKAFGRLCIALNEDICIDVESTAMKVISVLMDLTDIKGVEVHLAIGEALATAAARWESDSVMVSLDVDISEPLVPQAASRVKFLLNKLLQVSSATKPSVLRAYGIWLFSLIQYCSRLKEVQVKFRECQAVFMRLLSARDELVQETASRGLSLVFEKGTDDLRKTLVADLTAVFTGDAKDRMKVGEDSEVFGAGDLETSDGKSITSYKDVISLANEAGDPSLVYKLMNMSMHAATWSTRSAFGRFGLGSILSEAPLPPTLYPKLYRYRFDPVGSVRKSMNEIWNAAIKDSSDVLEQHFDLIMQELLDSLWAREWRAREASCGAIEELVGGRPFKQYGKYYEELWSRVVKVLDDKKTTVQKAAFKLCMSLSKSLTNQLEANPNSVAATGMMACAIPFLLSEKAMGSNVEEVSLISATTIINITKHGGKAVNPYASTIIIDLLGFMATSESAAIGYMQNKYGGQTADMIDKARSAFATKSPLWEAIENCLRNADKTVIQELIPRLEETVKTAIGVPTKLGCSHLIIALATRHGEDFSRYVAGILKLMRKQIFDKNEEVARAYARGAAYLFRIGKPRSKELFTNQLIDSYFKAEAEDTRRKVADAVEAISKLALDQFKAMESSFLPLVFVGKHDTDEKTRKIFASVWESNIGSDRTVARILDETVCMIDRGLETTQWALRHGAALATASVVEALASTLAARGEGEMAIKSAQTVWPVMEKSLALKTFDDKERIFEAFVTLTAKCPDFWKGDKEKLFKKIALREVNRNNLEYKIKTIPQLARFARTTKFSLLESIIEIVIPGLNKIKEGERASMESEEKQLELAKAGVEAVVTGIVPEAADVTKSLEKIYETLVPGYLEHESMELVRRAWYPAVGLLFEEISHSVAKRTTTSSTATAAKAVFLGPKAEDLLVKFARSMLLDEEKGMAMPINTRMDRAKAYQAIAKVTAGTQSKETQRAISSEVLSTVRAAGEKLLVEERAIDVQKILREAIGMF